MRITIRARTLERVHAEAGYMLALGPAFYRLSSCKQGESIYDSVAISKKPVDSSVTSIVDQAIAFTGNFP